MQVVPDHAVSPPLGSLFRCSPTVGRYCPDCTQSWKIDLSRGGFASAIHADDLDGLVGLQGPADTAGWPSSAVPGGSDAGIPRCNTPALDNRGRR